MKKLFSNKSGFTLIEIIVAFAIFAIMASMIMTMVRLTVAQRNSNNEYAKEIENQTLYLTEHYITDADKFGDSETADGKITLDFGTANGGKIEIEYATRSTDSTNANVADGLNYFVGKGVDYTDSNDDPLSSDSTSNSPLGNNQTSRVDTRISGSKNLKYVLINQVIKDTTYSVAGQSRYIIQCSADGQSTDSLGGTVPSEDVPYLQYRIRFADNNSTSPVEVTEDDGKTYIYDVPNDVTILDYGYVNLGTLSLSSVNFSTGENVDALLACFKSPTEHTPSSSATNNRYVVEQTSNSIIRIGAPFGSSGGYEMDGSKFTTFYVVLDGDPQLTTDYFGENAQSYTSTGYQYFPFPVSGEAGAVYSNIYGAYEYTKTEKTGD